MQNYSACKELNKSILLVFDVSKTTGWLANSVDTTAPSLSADKLLLGAKYLMDKEYTFQEFITWQNTISMTYSSFKKASGGVVLTTQQTRNVVTSLQRHDVAATL